MAIKKVWIENGCISCGLCEDICPEVFKMNSQAWIVEGVNFADYEQAIIEAVENCPVEVIKYSK